MKINSAFFLKNYYINVCNYINVYINCKITEKHKKKESIFLGCVTESVFCDALKERNTFFFKGRGIQKSWSPHLWRRRHYLSLKPGQFKNSATTPHVPYERTYTVTTRLWISQTWKSVFVSEINTCSLKFSKPDLTIQIVPCRKQGYKEL
jgi:hypothetical protein